MRQDTYSAHIDSSCQSCSSSSQDSPDTSIDEIMSRPLSTPLTAVEQKLQSRLAKRSLAASPEENVLKIKTGGQVSLSSTIHRVIFGITLAATYICPSASAKSGVSKGIQQVLASTDTSSERHSKETQCQ